MIKYDCYVVSRDFLHPRNSPHLFYLLGRIEKENIEHVVASYSVKTKQMIIHNADLMNFPLSTDGLSKLVSMAEECYKKDINNDNKK